jgi:hypothetical protein
MDPAALQSLTPEQKQAVMAQAQGQANQQIMASMIESMTARCFDKCVGASVSYTKRLYCDFDAVSFLARTSEITSLRTIFCLRLQN